MSVFFGDSAGIQTRNLLIRSQMLYSVKLRNQTLLRLKRCKDTPLFPQSYALKRIFYKK